MGLFWGRKKKAADPSPAPQQQQPKHDEEDDAKQMPSSTTATTSRSEAQRPPEGALLASETSVFEFGSAGGGEEPVTLAGYCPVSDGLEPCRWEVLPSGGEAPKFRIIF